MQNDNLTKEDGSSVKTLLKKLDSIYDLDKEQKQYLFYEGFEEYKRTSGISVQNYISNLRIDLSQPVLAYRLLKNANISEEETTIVRGTAKKLDLDEMKLALLRVFDQLSRFEWHKFPNFSIEHQRGTHI